MAWRPMYFQPSLRASDIKLKQLKFGMDQGVTILQDNQSSLSFSSPYFRTSATVEIPKLTPDVNILIGWIQVCTELTLACVYGDLGIISWEIPELVTGKYAMVSDSDSVVFPWYGAPTSFTGVLGPTRCKFVRTVFMDDNLNTEIAWVVPSKPVTPTSTLSFVYRKQKFNTYLALKDMRTDAIQILKTLEWSIEIAIEVDVSKPLGKRSTLLGPLQQQCPKIVPEHLAPPLQCNALFPPTCNTGQIVLWRPFQGYNEIIHPPMISTVDPHAYSILSKDYTNKLKLCTKENFLNGQL